MQAGGRPAGTACPAPSRTRAAPYARPVTHDRYGTDVLRPGSPSARGPRTRTSTPTPAEPGLVVEEVTTGWVGAVVRVEKSGGMHVVVLEDRRGATRTFPLGPGFWVDGAPVELTAAGAPHDGAGAARPGRRPARVAVHGARARVARGSRIWVEGRHDAELVEKVWGDDLRLEGVVVEPLHGVDDLAAAIRDFAPEPGRRARRARRPPRRRARRRAGSPPRRSGRRPPGRSWCSATRTSTSGRPSGPSGSGWRRGPTVERGTEWKRGILRELGWPADDQADVARAWQRILGSVRSYADLEPSLLGRVEELIDFVHRAERGARPPGRRAARGSTSGRSGTTQGQVRRAGRCRRAPPAR